MNRKYSQRGYQEGDRDDDSSRPSAPQRQQLTKEERIHRKGMRHAIDRDAKEVLRCQVCGRSIFDFGTISASSACPHCNAALHCCRTCAQFDSSARWQCHAEITEAIPDKNMANQCAAYAPRLVLDSTGRRSASPGSGKSGDPRSQFEDLFKR